MDGIEAARLSRGRQQLQHQPVVRAPGQRGVGRCKLDPGGGLKLESALVFKISNLIKMNFTLKLEPWWFLSELAPVQRGAQQVAAPAPGQGLADHSFS